MPTLRLAGILGVLLATPFYAQPRLTDGSWPLDAPPPELRESVAHAKLIVLSMQAALQRELNSALAQGGPDLAVNSCHIDLTGAIWRINREPHVQAGRTSDRLRNPSNAPRAWAAPFVQANAGRLARDVEGFVVDLDDRVGILQSIAHRPVCASCHGPATAIPPGVRATLDVRYPRDRAVGFQDGEIRGWFWVELPKTRRPSARELR